VDVIDWNATRLEDGDASLPPAAWGQRVVTFETRVVVRNTDGLHARLATVFVLTAQRFNCQVNVIEGANRANGKSILALMALGAACGSELTIAASGEGAEDAVRALAALFVEAGR
jgi:phosphocarrier protein HPr